MSSARGFDLILPYLPDLAPFLLDDQVSEVMVTQGRVFIDRGGTVHPQSDVVLTDKSLDAAVTTIARLLGDDISKSSPLLDSRLPDGSRVAAVYRPCSLNGTTLTIRKFVRHFSPVQLLEAKCITGEVLESISRAVEDRQNVLISGATSGGKTTFLGAFLQLIPSDDRLIVIEKPAELRILHQNAVRWEAVDEIPARPAVSVGCLLRAALRHRPDRIIIGEVRDQSAYDLLQALNTGHSGTFSTIHSDSADSALYRLSSLALSAAPNLVSEFLRSETARAIQFVVHVKRFCDGARRVSELIRVCGYDTSTHRFLTEQLYTLESK